MSNTSFSRKIPVKARPVDFFEQHTDHDCALYAAMGFSTKFIAEKTGLSDCQIGYRIAKAGLTTENGTSRMDFRNGTSPFCRPLLSAARRFVDQDLKKHLQKHLG